LFQGLRGLDLLGRRIDTGIPVAAHRRLPERFFFFRGGRGGGELRDWGELRPREEAGAVAAPPRGGAGPADRAPDAETGGGARPPGEEPAPATPAPASAGLSVRLGFPLAVPLSG